MKSVSFLSGVLGGMLCCLSISPAIAQDASVAVERSIKVDYQKVKGPLNTMFKECIGAGRANEGLRADWQQQLAEVRKDCGFKYIRMHGLLTDDMGFYHIDSKGKPEYNYQYIDVLYDYIVSLGMKPFVELGFMPNSLASAHQSIFWWRGNVTPPHSYELWGDMIKNLAQHFTERYGTDEVKSWYFEVWNEPNLFGFWAGTQEEYFKLYRYAATAIKQVNKDYKVGGPATAGAAWVPETIHFCVENKVPIDFISTHTYGVRQGYLDEFGTTGTVLSADEKAVSGDIINSRKQISESPLKNLELHYTEWSASYTPADPIHDSYHEAAYILEKLKQSGDAANSMSYWVFTDIFEEAGPRFTPFHGGFGLMNTQGIKKPAYFAYSLLNKLGTTELVNSDSRSWVCRDAKGGVQALLWDYTYTLPKDSVNNQAYYIKDLPAKAKGKVTLSVDNIPAGKYQVEVYKVGYRVNDAYTSYLDMGKPSQLSKQQVTTLKEKNSGAPISTVMATVGTSKHLILEYSIRENDLIMVNITKK